MTHEEREQALSEEDYIELRHRFGTVVESVVRDMVSGKGERWEQAEQEPCEDEYIKVPKKALKYRTTGMVAYNAEWLKNNFEIERAVICGAKMVDEQERSE